MKVIIANPNQYVKIVETEDIEETIAQAIGGVFDRTPFFKTRTFAW